MKPNLFIRADGSAEIGLGHLVRCISLSAILKDHYRITFFCREIPEQMQEEINSLGLGLVKSDREHLFFDLLEPGDIVVLDGYSFDSSYQESIKKIGCSLVCIDDIYDREFHADLIINHAPGVTPDHYSARPWTRYALGTDYALLRPAFLEQAKKERNINSAETVFICFGGSDFQNLTKRTLRAVLDFEQFKKIIIIAGSSYRHEQSLRKARETDSRIKYHHSVNEQQMLSLMLDADLAVVPASGILFEVLAAGCGVISGIYTENQRNTYLGFRNRHAFIDAKKFETKNLKKALKLALESRHKKKNLVDGKSGGRILALFKTLQETKK